MLTTDRKALNRFPFAVFFVFDFIGPVECSFQKLRSGVSTRRNITSKAQYFSRCFMCARRSRFPSLLRAIFSPPNEQVISPCRGPSSCVVNSLLIFGKVIGDQVPSFASFTLRCGGQKVQLARKVRSHEVTDPERRNHKDLRSPRVSVAFSQINEEIPEILMLFPYRRSTNVPLVSFATIVIVFVRVPRSFHLNRQMSSARSVSGQYIQQRSISDGETGMEPPHCQAVGHIVFTGSADKVRHIVPRSLRACAPQCEPAAVHLGIRRSRRRAAAPD
jgi:hypothetical protein